MNLRIRAAGVALVAALATAASAGQAQARVHVADDPLEPAVVISTEHVNKSKRGLLGSTYNDSYLQAVVDRQSGGVRYELRQTLHYLGNFRDFQQAHYEGADGVGTAKLSHVDQNRPHCDVNEPQAACFEVVTFEVPQAALRNAAAAGDDSPWTFKFKPKIGREHRSEMPRAEIRALLSAVDAHQANRPMAMAAQTK